MKKLQRLTSATALALFIGVPVLAQTPCPTSPGQTEGMPCQGANGDGSGTETSTTTTTLTTTTTSATDVVINEVVADVLETMLSIF